MRKKKIQVKVGKQELKVQKMINHHQVENGSGGGSDNGGEQQSENGNKEGKKEEKSTKTEIVEDNYLLSERKTSWDDIKIKIERFTEVATEVEIDLKEMNIEEQDIQEFDNTLNEAIINVKDNDKINTAKNLGKLYSKLPLFIEKYSEDKLFVVAEKMKDKILKAYILLEEDNWEETKNSVKQALSYIEEARQISEQENKNKYDIKKTEALLKELEAATDLKNKDVFYIRYVNVMQELQAF